MKMLVESKYAARNQTSSLKIKNWHQKNKKRKNLALEIKISSKFNQRQIIKQSSERIVRGSDSKLMAPIKKSRIFILEPAVVAVLFNTFQCAKNGLFGERFSQQW